MAVMALDMKRFHAMFFDEATEHLANIESFLSNVGSLEIDRDEIAEIYRCAHSIKGAAATLGFDDMARVGHALADLLLAASKGEIGFTGAMIDACRGAREVLRRQLLAHRDGTSADEGAGAAICWLLKALRDHSGTPPSGLPANGMVPPPRRVRLDFVVSKALATNEILLDNMLEELAGLGRVVVVERPARGADSGAWRLELETGRSEQQIRGVLELMAEPGRLRIALADATADGTVTDAPVPVGQRPVRGESVWPDRRGSSGAAAQQDTDAADAANVVRLRELVAAIRASTGRIAGLAAQMEEASSAHASLLAEATELARQLDLPVRERAGSLAGDGFVVGVRDFSLSSARDSASMQTHRPSGRGCRAPLPKVKRPPTPRPSLEEEWENS